MSLSHISCSTVTKGIRRRYLLLGTEFGANDFLGQRVSSLVKLCYTLFQRGVLALEFTDASRLNRATSHVNYTVFHKKNPCLFFSQFTQMMINLHKICTSCS